MKITIDWEDEDGNVGTFVKLPDGSWMQDHNAGLRISGYDGPNVMRVLAKAVGTREIA